MKALLQRIWHLWKRFGQMMGDAIARVVLTIFYFTIFLPFAVGLKLFGDPLGTKPGYVPQWLALPRRDTSLEDARRLG